MSCEREEALSELVGEMLMLTLVLILMAVFAATASSFLPPPRDPSVTVIMDWEDKGTGLIDVHLYHKGGDFIKRSDLTVVLSENDTNRKYSDSNASFLLEPPDCKMFDLGCWITITNVPKKTYKVSLVTPRAVVFSGMVNPP